MQCQFCKKILEDVDALQLHQVTSCPAIEQASRSIEFENEAVEVVFKWLIDKIINVPSIFLIGSDMVDNIELKKGTGCFKSAQFTMPTGNYTGQLVIDNDIIPINEFEISLLSETVYLVINKNSSSEEGSQSQDVPSVVKQDDVPSSPYSTPRRSSSRGDMHDATNATMSPLHKEMLSHQIKNVYDFVDDIDESPLGNLLSEENMATKRSSCSERTLQQAADLSPDLLRISQLPRDSEADDSFYQSFATPSAFQTLDADVSSDAPSTPGENLPSLYGNLSEMLSEMATKDDQPSLDLNVSADLLEHELEDAMQDAAPVVCSVASSVGSSLSCTVIPQHDNSCDYLGNPMSKYNRTSSTFDGDVQQGSHSDIDEIVSVDYAGNSTEEMQRMKDLIENYKEVKLQLETNCESYDMEIDRLKKKCAQLEQVPERPDADLEEKDAIINELTVKAQSYETELNRLNQEVDNLKEMVEKYEENAVELETRCQSSDGEVARLTGKCSELELINNELQRGNVELKHAQEYEGSIDSKKDSLIAELNEKVQFCESEVSLSKEELQQAKGEVEQYKINYLKFETKCQQYDEEVKDLQHKCEDMQHHKGDVDKSKLYKGEIKRLDKELQRHIDVIENYKGNKVQLEIKCAECEAEVKLLQDKCDQLENIKENGIVPNESDSMKDRLIGELKVKAESCEYEMNRLHQEVTRLTDSVEDHKKMKFVLESKCQSCEEEIKGLRDKYQKRIHHQKTNEQIQGIYKEYKELEEKYEELQNSKQKLLDDYQGLEGAKNLHEEEVQLERKTKEKIIKELLEDKARLTSQLKQDTKSSDNSARMNINKLKSENRLLKDKLASIRNETDIDTTTATPPPSKENVISPHLRGYKPPVSAKSLDTGDAELVNVPGYSQYIAHTHTSSTSFSTHKPHEHTSSTEDYALPSRYNANKYNTKSDQHLTNHEAGIDAIMKRYSSSPVDLSTDYTSRRSRSERQYPDYNDAERTPRVASSRPRGNRARSLDRVSTAVEATGDSGLYKYGGSMTSIPFCPTSVNDLCVGMKISVNRANGHLSRGTVKWKGTLPRHSGDYIGVELESELGKHDGNLNGIQYFRCKGDRGIFVKFPKVIMAWK